MCVGGGGGRTLVHLIFHPGRDWPHSVVVVYGEPGKVSEQSSSHLTTLSRTVQLDSRESPALFEGVRNHERTSFVVTWAILILNARSPAVFASATCLDVW